MNRGARRSTVFGDDELAATFLQSVHAAALQFELEVHAYCVMSNHYHLLVRSVRGNLSRAMRHVSQVFTQDLNRRRKWDGPVFRGRFKSQLIDSEEGLLPVAAYIHMNPIRAGLIRRLDQRYPSSHRAYLGLDVPPDWLRRERLWALAGGQQAFADYVTSLRMGRMSWPEVLDLEWGWLKRHEADVVVRAETHDGLAQPPTMSVDAVLTEVCDIAGATRVELLRAVRGPKANPARRFAVWALAHGTALTQSAIGLELGMKAAHVGMTMGRIGRMPGEPLAGWIRTWELRRRAVQLAARSG